MKDIGNTICFATSYNRKGKHDGDEFMREMSKFRQAYSATKIIGQNAITKGTDKKLREQIDKAITDSIVHYYSQNFVFFMHGWWRELIGAGHNIWTTHEIADTISHFRDDKKPLNIVLYACGCGGGTKKWKNIHEYHVGSRWDMRGEFGFAMRLANDLSELGIHDYRIFAHVGSGHVTERPFCVWITEEFNPNWFGSKDPPEIKEGSDAGLWVNTNVKRIIKRRTIVPYRSWASLDRKGRRQWLRWVKFLQETKTGRFEAPFLTEEELAEVIGE
jgi:hypothetical protein